MSTRLTIDGSHGAGGGQIVRTSVTLASLLGRPVRIVNVRANRRRPGLAAQHLTAVRAAAAVCGGALHGDELGSSTLVFEPGSAPRAGDYAFDVAAARAGASAGSASLVLQTVLVPLVVTEGESTVVVRGGTHVPLAPPTDFLLEAWLPLLARTGCRPALEEVRTGWFPAGGGEVRVTLRGAGAGARFDPGAWTEAGELRRVTGRALAANLPAHIPRRMADRARSLLGAAGVRAAIEPVRVRATCPGAALFLAAEYEHVRVGFGSLGRPGKSSESVAEEAVDRLLAHRDTGAALDRHLADQVLVPAALAEAPFEFTVERVTDHLVTNAWVVDRFGAARVEVEGRADGTGRVRVEPRTGR